jgi:hypothetical protein
VSQIDTRVLTAFLTAHQEHAEISSLAEDLNRFLTQGDIPTPAKAWMALYDSATELLEAWMWQEDFPPERLDTQRRLFQEMEAGLVHFDSVPRHAFTLVIPVADRPQQLQHVLTSLLSLSRRFAYAGPDVMTAKKLRVLIADDSRQTSNQQKTRQIALHFEQQGLSCEYFGPREQLSMLAGWDSETLTGLDRILGARDPGAFTHKGASITRNLCYLKLSDWLCESPNRLIWFCDSDQAFCIPRRGDGEDCYPIHFFHQIDRIFRERKTAVLTGKVVGDPPVSPSVMGGNFLDDVTAFLSQIAEQKPEAACQFHHSELVQVQDAAYHDMADLFGFQQPRQAFRYACTLQGPHDNRTCLMDFVGKLPGFFDGVHPTRQSHYAHEPLMPGIKSARTVYTGNYVINARALEYFIPFATLGLRMAGPVLGRILQAELGAQFVSANLPLLHRRALAEQGRAEFRSGIEQRAQRIDLSGEFIRQYYGDVMLFTIQTLVQNGYPNKPIADAEIEAELQRTETSMHAKYTTKQQQITRRIEDLQAWLDTHRENPMIAPAGDSLQALIDDMRHNFGTGATAYQHLDEDQQRVRTLQTLLTAIREYVRDRSLWNSLLKQTGKCHKG